LRGLGLGLFIVRQIVLAHGGDVSVESTATDGTTFIVCLPRRLGEAASAR
jgi:signal transduction histidine kinase